MAKLSTKTPEQKRRATQMILGGCFAWVPILLIFLFVFGFSLENVLVPNGWLQSIAGLILAVLLIVGSGLGIGIATFAEDAEVRSHKDRGPIVNPVSGQIGFWIGGLPALAGAGIIALYVYQVIGVVGIGLVFILVGLPGFLWFENRKQKKNLAKQLLSEQLRAKQFGRKPPSSYNYIKSTKSSSYKDCPMDKLNLYLFQREPLHSKEKRIACLDRTFDPWYPIGLLLTNQALISWTLFDISRYNFSEISNVNFEKFPPSGNASIEFVHNGQKISFKIPDGFLDAIIEVLPK
jgi:hypothetical protein